MKKMAIVKKKITPLLKEFPKYKILEEIEKKAKQEVNFFTTLETDSDPIQMRRNVKNWKTFLRNWTNLNFKLILNLRTNWIMRT